MRVNGNSDDSLDALWAWMAFTAEGMYATVGDEGVASSEMRENGAWEGRV